MNKYKEQICVFERSGNDTAVSVNFKDLSAKIYKSNIKVTS